MTKAEECGKIGRYKFIRRVISATPINHEADSADAEPFLKPLRIHKFIRRVIEAVITRRS